MNSTQNVDSSMLGHDLRDRSGDHIVVGDVHLDREDGDVEKIAHRRPKLFFFLEGLEYGRVDEESLERVTGEMLCRSQPDAR